MIKYIYEESKRAIKNMPSDPVNSLGYLLPVLTGLLTFISGLVAYVRFIAEGGYTRQIRVTKELGLFGGYSEKFTTGTTGMITAGTISKIILVLVCAELVLSVINYFKNTGKVKRIGMITALVIMGIQITLSVTILRIASGDIIIDEQSVYKALEPLEGITINPRAIWITYAVLTLGSIICFFVLMFFTKECKWMMHNTVIALAVSYMGIPLSVLLLENVIPLVTGLVALVIIGVVVVVGFKIITIGEGVSDSITSYEAPNNSSRNSDTANSSPSRSSAGSSWNSGYDTRAAKQGDLTEQEKERLKRGERIVKENCAYIPKGFKLYKVRGFAHDYVASDNGLVTREVCSLELFEKGKYHIYDAESGREIMTGQIPWAKQDFM